MDLDDFGVGREPSPEPVLEDDLEEENDDWRDRDRSQTPVYDADVSFKSKPRKRLIKKSSESERVVVLKEGDNWADDKFHELVDEYSDEEEEGRAKRLKKEKRHKGEKRGLRLPGKSSSDKAATAGEVKEMWDTIAGGDSEVIINF